MNVAEGVRKANQHRASWIVPSLAGLVVAFGIVSASSRSALSLLAGIVITFSWFVWKRGEREDRFLYVRAYLVAIPVLNVFRETGLVHLPFGVIITPAAVGLLATLCATGLRIVRQGSDERREGEAKGSEHRNWVIPLGVLIVISGFIATVFAQNLPTYSRTPSLAWSLYLDGVILTVAFLLLLTSYRPDRQALHKLAGAVVLSVLVAMIVGTAFIILGFVPPVDTASSGNAVVATGVFRTYATFTYGNEDIFATVAVLAIPLGICLSIVRSGTRRIGWILTTLTIGFGEIITFSRGGLIATLIGILVFIVFYRPARTRLTGFIVTLGILIWVIPVTRTLILARFTESDLANTYPIQARTIALHLGWHLVFSRPLGIGGAGFGQVWLDAGQAQPILQSPHDLLLGIPDEYGIIAGIAFIILVAIALLRSATSAVQSGNRDALAAASLAALVGGLLASTLTIGELSHLAGTVPLATPTVLLFAVIGISLQLKRKVSHETEIEIEPSLIRIR